MIQKRLLKNEISTQASKLLWIVVICVISTMLYSLTGNTLFSFISGVLLFYVIIFDLIKFIANLTEYACLTLGIILEKY